jgi:hypothetical protein
VGVIEDGASSDGEMMFAFQAIKLAILRYVGNSLTLAARAFNAVGPAKLYQNLAAFFVGIEEFLNVKECHG